MAKKFIIRTTMRILFKLLISTASELPRRLFSMLINASATPTIMMNLPVISPRITADEKKALPCSIEYL